MLYKVGCRRRNHNSMLQHRTAVQQPCSKPRACRSTGARSTLPRHRSHSSCLGCATTAAQRTNKSKPVPCTEQKAASVLEQKLHMRPVGMHSRRPRNIAARRDSLSAACYAERMAMVVSARHQVLQVHSEGAAKLELLHQKRCPIPSPSRTCAHPNQNPAKHFVPLPSVPAARADSPQPNKQSAARTARRHPHAQACPTHTPPSLLPPLRQLWLLWLWRHTSSFCQCWCRRAGLLHPKHACDGHKGDAAHDVVQAADGG